MNETVETMPTPSCPVCGEQVVAKRNVVRAGNVAICTQCGTWHRVPRPSEQELKSIYDKNYYDAWGINEDENVTMLSKQATFLPLFKRIEAKLPDTGDLPVILDVGAATGLLLDIAKDKNWDCYALEINPYAIEILRDKFGDAKVCGKDIAECIFPEHTFDIITMTDLIEHSLDVTGTLKKTATLLKPTGMLCITTPAVDSLSRYLMGTQWLHFKEEHIQYFTRKALKEAILAAGFNNVKIYCWPKTLTIDYINRQLRVYPHRALTPLVKGLSWFLPTAIRTLPMRFRCGEILAIATL